MTVAFALVLCAAFYPLVFQDRTFAPNGRLAWQSGRPAADYAYPPPKDPVILDGGAFVWLFEPMGRIAHEAYADGAAPLWNPYTGLGVPLLGDLQTAPFGPFSLLRALGARPPAALVAALGYLLVPAYVLWMHAGSLSVEALAPWLLLALLALLRRPEPCPSPASRS